jgi:non-heme chloroperoxidase
VARRASIASIACLFAILQPLAAPAMQADVTSTSFITTDGVRLRVLEACPPGMTAPASRAPVIGFVPGWSMPAEIWSGQLQSLGATHCVAALDPRGQGASEVAPGGYAIGRRAEDLREFVARYPRVILVGWSLGALEALEYVSRDGASAIDALVLVDSSVGEDPPPPAAGDFLESLRGDRRAAMEDFVRGMFHSARGEEEIAALTDAALRMPLEASLSLFPRSVPREHWRQAARSFPKPLLYVVTAQFAEQAQSLRWHRPATQIALFEEAGHALFVDEPDRFNDMLARFVDEVAPRRD